MSSTMIATKREDYRPSDYSIKTVDLSVELHPTKTLVTSKLKVTRNDDRALKLELDGESLEFISLHINGQLAIENKDFSLHEQGLSVVLDCDSADIEIQNYISPESNSSLEGLYFVSGAYCSQCEAQGFRKITYFLDRPDVLSVYTVTIISDDPALTYLLSNGNKIEDVQLEDGRRKVVWHDPHYKPCYLFALVAGHFDCLQDSFVTSEGREVTLQVFVDEGRLHQAGHAMSSLKKAMIWDEQTYGLAYDLDIYMIVAVDFFNMGAMENKGLNVFNSKFVLAEPSTATDEDYFNIESIIAHEYFHNWTGNRVTCRDWFQLSLKEGLTVFRDQRFSADMSSELGCRIKQVKVMREHQFSEDSGPMSHPIRPDEVMEMNNFYTVTVYDKGAEVIRMLHTLLSPEGFRKGMDLYFERFDGQAVTCDDFVQAMQDANQLDLSHFKQWYAQSGTPLVCVNISNDLLSLEQINNATADQSEKQPLYIPINLSVIDESGNEHYVDAQKTGTFVLDCERASINLPAHLSTGVPVILSDFSAPVRIAFEYTLDELLHVIRYSKSDYAKWDASQILYSKLVKNIYRTTSDENNRSAQKSQTLKDAAIQADDILSAFVDTLSSSNLSADVLAQLLTPPSFETLSSDYESLDPQALLQAIDQLTMNLAQAAGPWCKARIDSYQNLSYAYEQTQVNQRSLLAVCLKLTTLNSHNDSAPSGLQQRYQLADNMTDKLAILKAAQHADIEAFDSLMLVFEKDHGNDAVVMDKWFALHATAERDDILSRLDLLQAHSQFSIKNPNKVRSLIGSFAFYNNKGFHAPDGSGYRYVVDYLAKLDKINPQVAARIITPMLQFKRYNQTHQALIESQLARLFSSTGLSKDLFEKLSKALAQREN